MYKSIIFVKRQSTFTYNLFWNKNALRYILVIVNQWLYSISKQLLTTVRVLKKFLSRWRIFGSRRRLDMPQAQVSPTGGPPPANFEILDGRRCNLGIYLRKMKLLIGLKNAGFLGPIFCLKTRIYTGAGLKRLIISSTVFYLPSGTLSTVKNGDIFLFCHRDIHHGFLFIIGNQ